MQWPKETGKKTRVGNTNVLHKKLKIDEHDPQYYGCEIRFSGRVKGYILRVTVVGNPMTSHT